jgi:membrane fusion protein, multidrug efflux system
MNSIKILNLSLAAGLLIIGTSCAPKKESKAEAAQPAAPVAVAVKSMTAKTEPITRYIDYTASLIAFEEVHLAPASPGRIEKINVEIGSNVSKGQVVALMDRTNLEQAHINLMKLETDFNRLDALKKTNSIADQQYDQIRSAYEVAKTSYQFLLDNTQLKVPFSGIISGKYFEDGEIYSGAPVVTVGKPAIVSVIQINQLKALIGISSNYYPQVKTGMKAEITSELYPGESFAGEIYRIYPTIDNATKTFTVEVKIPNPGLRLRPGMFSKIRLNLGQGDAILIPNIAILKQTGTNDMYVFLNRNNVAVKTPVTTGRMVDDRIEITTGIKDNDEVIILGQNKLEDKMQVIIKN